MKKCSCALLALILLFALAACRSEPPTVEKLIIVNAPDKVNYEEGELFDPSGTVINAEMSDGTVVEDVDYNSKRKDPFTRTDTYVVFTYEGQTVTQNITVSLKGNNDIYSVENTPSLADSPLAGKTYLFLGSSVTYGYGSEGESMADFIAKRNSCTVIKEAVSGTTLAVNGDDAEQSYVTRLEHYVADPGKPESLDAVVVQLSTNGMYHPDWFGTVTASGVTGRDSFDTATTYGAMEYIIALVKETWDCPVVFYTNNNMGNVSYADMVAALHEIEVKWDITVIDFYNDPEINNISDEEEALYMSDAVHPTKAGYREWWTPRFEQVLEGL